MYVAGAWLLVAAFCVIAPLSVYVISKSLTKSDRLISTAVLLEGAICAGLLLVSIKKIADIKRATSRANRN